jgi:exo-beta-1,3-glucanase (GH17 family)
MSKIIELLIVIAIMASVGGLTFAPASGANPPNFIGVNYGPFHTSGEAPGTPITDDQFKADLGIMAKKFTYIKTYGVDTASRLDRVVPLASANFPNLKIYLGVFEQASNRGSVTQPQLDLAIQQANAYPSTVAAIVVGNECLDTDSNPDPITVQLLINDLSYVRQGLNAGSKVLVTTCLGYASAQKYGNQLQSVCDVMMVNIYPFYGTVDISQAWSNLSGAYNAFVNQFSPKTVIVGETGWPSEGPANGNATPSIDNEQTCVTQILSKGPSLGPIFLFEAFDEPWKTDNAWEAHWGLWDQYGAPKISLGTTLTRDTIWLGDRNGNGVEDVALLHQDLDRGETEAHIRDGRTGSRLKAIPFFGSGWIPVALVRLSDLNANGSDELAVLAYNDQMSLVRVMVKDTLTGRVLSRVDFDNDFRPKELAVRGDNLLAVLATHPVDHVSQIEVRDALEGTLIRKIRLPNEHYVGE